MLQRSIKAPRRCVFKMVRRSAKGQRVLAVDDDAPSRGRLERALPDPGFEPLLAGTGEEGLRHWLAPRVRAHVFLYLLAYHVEWHMRRKLAPMLYEDDDRAGGEALRARNNPGLESLSALSDDPVLRLPAVAA
jgi:hypothetical protein